MRPRIYALSAQVEELLELAVESRGRARRRLARLFASLEGELETLREDLARSRQTLVALDPQRDPLVSLGRCREALAGAVSALRRLPRLSGPWGQQVWDAAGEPISELGVLARALLHEAVAAALEGDDARRQQVAGAAPEVSALFDEALARLVAAVLEEEGRAGAALKAQRLLHALEEVADHARSLADPEADLPARRDPAEDAPTPLEAQVEAARAARRQAVG